MKEPHKIEDICPKCNGNGWYSGRDICPKCNGNGWYSGREAGHDCDGTEESCNRNCPIQIQNKMKK